MNSHPNIECINVKITGNVGLGAESVRHLASHGAHVYLAARNESKAQTTIASIMIASPMAKITFLSLDLSSLASVKEAASTFARSSSRLDILMNNAGIMACPPGLTEDGYEIQFGTNHVGHALLIKLLLPTMLATAESGGDVRIVTLSSGAVNMSIPEGLRLSACTTDMSSCSPIERYFQSKLANLLYSAALAERYPAITCVTVNPGFVNTGIVQGPKESWPFLRPIFSLATTLFSKSVGEGAKTQLWAATVEKTKVQSGQYYDPVGIVGIRRKHGDDPNLREELWDWTQQELEKHGF
jgi:NAD(P)-dependent dehydrogenase (short-subunit alcohol dehydrogenase family)